jgi:hypothetical protein
VTSHRDWTRGRCRQRKAARLRRELARLTLGLDRMYTAGVYASLAMADLRDRTIDLYVAVLTLDVRGRRRA